ncbi:hypothetical protein BGW42_005346 [Actinomortierella wolfii]|nr:hypothetical protein BGW42_005346 [Actinomortierella wolfii]
MIDGPGNALDGPHGTYIVEPYVSVAEIQRIAILPFEVYVTDGTRHRRLELSSGFCDVPDRYALNDMDFETDFLYIVFIVTLETVGSSACPLSHLLPSQPISEKFSSSFFPKAPACDQYFTVRNIARYPSQSFSTSHSNAPTSRTLTFRPIQRDSHRVLEGYTTFSHESRIPLTHALSSLPSPLFDDKGHHHHHLKKRLQPPISAASRQTGSIKRARIGEHHHHHHQRVTAAGISQSSSNNGRGSCSINHASYPQTKSYRRRKTDGPDQQQMDMMESCCGQVSFSDTLLPLQPSHPTHSYTANNCRTHKQQQQQQAKNSSAASSASATITTQRNAVQPLSLEAKAPLPTQRTRSASDEGLLFEFASSHRGDSETSMEPSSSPFSERSDPRSHVEITLTDVPTLTKYCSLLPRDSAVRSLVIRLEGLCTSGRSLELLSTSLINSTATSLELFLANDSATTTTATTNTVTSRHKRGALDSTFNKYGDKDRGHDALHRVLLHPAWTSLLIEGVPDLLYYRPFVALADRGFDLDPQVWPLYGKSSLTMLQLQLDGHDASIPSTSGGHEYHHPYLRDNLAHLLGHMPCLTRMTIDLITFPRRSLSLFDASVLAPAHHSLCVVQANQEEGCEGKEKNVDQQKVKIEDIDKNDHHSRRHKQELCCTIQQNPWHLIVRNAVAEVIVDMTIDPHKNNKEGGGGPSALTVVYPEYGLLDVGGMIDGLLENQQLLKSVDTFKFIPRTLQNLQDLARTHVNLMNSIVAASSSSSQRLSHLLDGHHHHHPLHVLESWTIDGRYLDKREDPAAILRWLRAKGSTSNTSNSSRQCHEKHWGARRISLCNFAMLTSQVRWRKVLAAVPLDDGILEELVLEDSNLGSPSGKNLWKCFNKMVTTADSYVRADVVHEQESLENDTEPVGSTQTTTITTTDTLADDNAGVVTNEKVLNECVGGNEKASTVATKAIVQKECRETEMIYEGRSSFQRLVIRHCNVPEEWQQLWLEEPSLQGRVRFE